MFHVSKWNINDTGVLFNTRRGKKIICNRKFQIKPMRY